MRECWREADLPQPAFQIIETESEIPRAASEIGYPIILKPAMNWGSRGVSLVVEPAELSWAIGFARPHCRNGRFVVEQYLQGTEMTIEGLVQKRVPRILAKSDKEAQSHPKYRVAMALNYPASFERWQLESADNLVSKAVLALGVENGAFHCECMVNNEGVYLVELGARGGGGHIFGQIVEAVSGICMPQALVRILLGDAVDIAPRYQRGACYRFFAPPSGVFRSVRGVEEARSLPGIMDFGFSMEPGTVVGPIAGDADRPGFVVATGATREEAVATAERALGLVSYVVDSPTVGGIR
jgi:biotin carboxylase